MYWVPDEEECWVCGTLVENTARKGVSRYQLQSGRIVEVKAENCLAIGNPQATADSPDDLISLSEVNEATILNAIRIRFLQEKIYTACGSVLMVMNPFAVIENLYGDAQIEYYSNPFSDGLTPHIYLISSRAYSLMCSTQKNQSILISGESGAGKTESTKQCLSLLTKLAQPPTKSIASGSATSSVSNTADVGQRIIAASPILEAFGNAQTVRNPNSSRFGKWMELNFDKDNRITGSTIISYLLEKSRLTSRDAKLERNYHIFYQMLRGFTAEDLQKYSLKRETFHYSILCREPGVEAPYLKDVECFQETMNAFEDMGFGSEAVDDIMRVIAGILHLGNVEFDDQRGGEASSVRDAIDERPGCSNCSALLGVDTDMLSYALCNRTMQSGSARKSLTVINLSPEKAADSRDSLIRAIYDKLFLDIVFAINVNNKTSGGNSSRSLGLLDIFGFEIFVENSIEQLCINYCNEMLQNHFNYVIFTVEKELYLREGIVCETIVFKDNLPIMTDIETAFKALDEEAKIPKGSSKTWFDKMKKLGPAKLPNLSFPTSSKDVFTVLHYAGMVTYNPISFMEKNVESLNNDLVSVMLSSSHALLQRLFYDLSESQGSGTSSAKAGGGRARSGSEAAVKSGSTAGKQSIAFKFQAQLTSLMTMLKATESHFVRCVKSNSKCRPLLYEPQLVQKQLLYSGVFEVVKIQQSGMPIRKPHDMFIARFRCLLPSGVRYGCKTSQQLVSSLLQHGYDLPNIQSGKKLTFYKGYEERVLESRRANIYSAAGLKSQTFWRYSIRKYLYRQIQRIQGDIKAELQKFDIEQCKVKLSKLQELTAYMARISLFPILDHVNENMLVKIRFLEDQLLAVRQAEELLAQRSVAALDQLSTSLPQWARLSIETHPAIIKCNDLVQRYAQANAFISSITTIGDGKSIDDLTMVDLSIGIEILTGFKDVFSNSQEYIRTAETRRIAIKNEFENLSTSLIVSLNNEPVSVDEFGAISFAPSSTSSNPKSKIATLSSALSAIAIPKLISKDAKCLVRDCQKILTIRNELVPAGMLTEIVEMASSFESKDSAIDIQAKAISDWATAKMMSGRLEQCLASGQIGIGDHAVDFVVDIDVLQDQIQQLAKFENLNRFVVTLVEIGQYILQLRKAFVSCDWATIDRLLIEASSYATLQRMSQCMKEVDCVRWHQRCHTHVSALLSICHRSVFGLVTTAFTDWSALRDDLPVDQKNFTEARNFAEQNSLVASINELVTATGLLLQLRSAVAARDFHTARPTYNAVQTNYRAVFLAHSIFDHMNSELNRCNKLIESLELEHVLEESLMHVPPCPEDGFFQDSSLVKHLVAGTKSIANAVKDCENVREPSSVLIGRLAVGRLIIRGRELLGVDNPVDCLARNWEESLTEYRRKAADIVVTIGCCKAEFNAVIKELERRSLYWDYASLITESVVAGTLGKVYVISGAIGTDFGQEKVKKINVRLNLAQPSLPPAVIAELTKLKKFVTDVVNLRLAISNKNWDEGTILCKDKFQLDQDSIESSEYGDIIVALSAAAKFLIEEINLCWKECSFQHALLRLRHALEHIEVKFDGSVVILSTISVDPIRASYSALQRFSTSNVEAEKLLKLASAMISLLTQCLKTQISNIATEEMVHQLAIYRELGLDDAMLSSIISFLQMQQFLGVFYNAVVSTESLVEKDHSLSLLVMKMSSRSSISPRANLFTRIIRMYSAIETGVEADDWLLVEEVAENMRGELEKFSAQTPIELKVNNYLQQRCESRALLARKVGTKAHLDVVLSAGPMKASAGGLGLAVPSQGTAIIEGFLNVSTGDRKQYAELDSMFSEVDSLLSVRKQAVRLLVDGWESVAGDQAVRTSVLNTDSASTRPTISKEEATILSKAIYFGELSDDLEATVVNDVVSWNEIRKAPSIDNVIYDQQISVVRKILDAFPNAIEDSALLKVLSAFHSLLTSRLSKISSQSGSPRAASKPLGGGFKAGLTKDLILDTDEPVVDDLALQKVRHLLNIVNIPNRCSEVLNRQVILLEKGSLLYEMKQLIKVGQEYFATKVYSKDLFSTLVAKLGNFGAATERDVGLHEESNLAIRCLSLARDVCWAVNMQLPDECDTFTKKLRADVVRTSAMFRKLALEWLDSLPVLRPVQVGIHISQRVGYGEMVVDGKPVDINELHEYPECIAYISATGTIPPAFDQILISSMCRFFVILIKSLVEVFPNAQRTTMQSLSMIFNIIPFDVDELALVNIIDVCSSSIRQLSARTEYQELLDTLTKIFELVHQFRSKTNSLNESEEYRPAGDKRIEIAVEMLILVQSIVNNPPRLMKIDPECNYGQRLGSFINELLTYRCAFSITRGGVNLSSFNPYSLSPWFDPTLAGVSLESLRAKIVNIDDVRTSGAYEELRYLLDLADKTKAGLVRSFSIEETDDVLRKLDSIRLISRGFELDAIYLPHKLLADYLYRRIYSLNIEKDESEIRSKVVRVLEGNPSEKSAVVGAIDAVMANIRTKPLLRDISHSFEGILLWDLIMRSDLAQGSCAKILVDVAPFFKFSDDSECQVDKILQSLVKVEDSRTINHQISMFLRNRRQINLVVGDADIASKPETVQNLVHSLRKFRSVDYQHPQVSLVDIKAVLKIGGHEEGLTPEVFNLIMQELALILQRVEEGKSEDFFYTLTQSIRSRVLPISSFGAFFATPEIVQLHEDSKTLYSSLLRILWKDSESLCLLCDLVTTKDPSLAPFEVKRVMNLLETDSPEFSSLAAEADLLGTLKFYYWRILEAANSDNHLSFKDLELPPLPEILDVNNAGIRSETSIARAQQIHHLVETFKQFSGYREKFLDIRRECLSGENHSTILNDAKELLKLYQEFAPKISEHPDTMPAWLASADAVRGVVNKISSELEKIIIICEDELFRFGLSDAMNAVSSNTLVISANGFETLPAATSASDELAVALGDYLLSKTLLLMSNSQKTVKSLSTVTNALSYLEVQSKRVPKDGLIYRANLLRLLREAIKNEDWLTVEPVRKPVAPEPVKRRMSTLQLAEPSKRRMSLNYIPPATVSIGDTDPSQLTSVQAIVQQWYATVEHPDIWEGSQEFKAAHDEVRNRLLFDILIKHASVGKSYDPGRVLQVVYTDAGYARPANVTTVVSRLDLHLDLLAIERTQAYWASEILSTSTISNILHNLDIKANGNELQNPSESIEVVTALYHKMMEGSQLTSKLASTTNNQPGGGAGISRRNEFLAVAAKAVQADGKHPLEVIDLFVEQLNLIPTVSSQDYVGILGAVHNWVQWKDEDWDALNISPQTRMIIARNRAVIAASRRTAMIKNFLAFYAHEAADVYLNLADMLLSTFGDSAVNSWQDRGAVIRTKLSTSFHIDNYFQEMVDIQRSGGLSIAAISAIGAGTSNITDLDDMKKLADCQLFHLQQALDAEPKCRIILSCAQTLKRIKDKLVFDSWAANRAELKCIMQTHVSNELWQVLSDTCFAVDAEITLQKVEDEIDRELDISKCTCRFDIANVMSQAVVTVSNLSLAAVGFYEQQTLLKASNPDDVTISPRLLEVIEWTLNMRLAILAEDWQMVELLEDIFKQKERFMLQYCPFGSQSLCKLANVIMKHSSALERLHSELGGNVQMSVDGHIEDDAPYFHFIDSDSLRFAVDNSNVEFFTEELQCLLKAAKFTLDLMQSIEADYWFDSSRLQELSGQSSDLDLQRRRSMYNGNSKRTSDMVSVSELLQTEKPGKYCPKAVLMEVDRVEREFQNQQVEVRLVQALQNGRDYLRETENFEDICTDELQEVVDIASSLRVRSLRNSKLFDAATKILHLRHAVKAGDWVAIRYCLSEASKSAIVPEAEYELKELMSISEERNHRMHVMISEAIKQNRVGGTYMRLDATAVDAMLLLSALRSSVNVPKISHEDKQLIYTAEKLKNIRISILMADYERLVVETSATDLTMVCPDGLEEMLLVKKAIDFFQNIKAVNQHLIRGGCLGVPGQLDVQNLSIYQLSNSLAAFHLSDCEDSVKQFLCCGMVMRDLRAAVKGSRWGTLELSNLLIDHILQQRIKKMELAHLSSMKSRRRSSTDDAQFTPTTSPSKVPNPLLSGSGGRKRSMTSSAALQTTTNIPFVQAPPSPPPSNADACTVDHLPIKVITFDYQYEMFGNVLLTNKIDFGIQFKSAHSSTTVSRRSRSGSRLGASSDANVGGENDKDAYDAYPYEVGHGFSAQRGPLLGVAPYKDLKRSDIYVLDMLNHATLDVMSVPRLLASMSFVIDAVEQEVLLLRDEVYNRVALSVLRRGLSYQSHFTEAMNYADDLETAEGGAVDLDAAIEVVAMLGCKSKEALRLLHTAVYVRDLRLSVLSKSAKQTLDLLGAVWEMKSNGLFDSIAVAEVDDVFHSVCSVNLKSEIYAKLGIFDKELDPSKENRVSEARRKGSVRIALDSDDADFHEDELDTNNDSGEQVVDSPLFKGIDISALKHSLRKIAAFKNPDIETTQILLLCTTYLSVRSAARCGVIARMESAMHRAQAHLQSITVRETARQFPRLKQLVETIYNAIESIAMEVDDLSQTILKSEPISKSTNSQAPNGVAQGDNSAMEFGNDVPNQEQGDVIDDMPFQTDDGADNKTAIDADNSMIQQRSIELGIYPSIRRVISTIRVAIERKADKDDIAVQVGGKFDTMLKEILSNEDESFTRGDIDGTILRVMCTLLLITMYLGTPSAEFDGPPTAYQQAAMRLRRERNPEEVDMVVVDVKVEILRKATIIFEFLLDEPHRHYQESQEKVKKEASKYFHQKFHANRALHESRMSEGADKHDFDIVIGRFDPDKRCQTRSLAQIGAVFAEFLPLTIQSTKHFVEIENSLLMLKSLLKSKPEYQKHPASSSSGLNVLSFFLAAIRRIHNGIIHNKKILR